MEEMLSPKSEESARAEQVSSWNRRRRRHDNGCDRGTVRAGEREMLVQVWASGRSWFWSQSGVSGQS